MSEYTLACGIDWTCPEHGWICNLELDHEGDHRCVHCPRPMGPGWSRAAKARAAAKRGEMSDYEPAMRDEVETTPDI